MQENTMINHEILSASSAILKKAKQLGAHLAGFANVADLKRAPSAVFAPKLKSLDKVIITRDGEMEIKPGEVNWPEMAKSVLVIAIEHPENKPELDWWYYGQRPPSGNKLLIDALKALSIWIPDNFNIDTFNFPYFIEQGGIYLKDAAVLAGLGCIGRNNMLVTTEFGPRVRLRAMALNIPIPSSGPSGFDPCAQCDDFCRKACPQHAFNTSVYLQETDNQVILPGRDGSYSRPSCHIQIKKNNDEVIEYTPEGSSKSIGILKFCRACEWSCPVGK